MRNRSLVFVLAVGFAICSRPAATQVLYASIIGAVQDSSGGVVPQAKITLISKDTGVRRETQTDEAGRYSMASVPGIPLWPACGVLISFDPRCPSAAPWVSTSQARICLPKGS